MARILRYTVPVNDQEHVLELPGPIVHVDARNPYEVELWAVELDADAPTSRRFTVVGTGHTFDNALQHVGSAVTAGGALVWHLMERVT